MKNKPTTNKHNFIAEAIAEHWGSRCKEFHPDCFCCRAWLEYDRIERLEAALRWIDQQRYIDRATIAAETSYQRATRMNAKLLEIMDHARAALEDK